MDLLHYITSNVLNSMYLLHWTASPPFFTSDSRPLIFAFMCRLATYVRCIVEFSMLIMKSFHRGVFFLLKRQKYNLFT